MKKILGKVIHGLMTPVYIVFGLCFVLMIKVQAITERLSQ